MAYKEYQGDFGGVTVDGIGHGQAAEEARAKPFALDKRGLSAPPDPRPSAQAPTAIAPAPIPAPEAA